MVELTVSVRALVMTQLFYMLLVGYLLGLMQYFGHMPIGVLLTFTLVAILFLISTALYLWGKRYGFIGIMALSIITIILQSPTLIHEATTGQTTTGIPISLDIWYAMTFLLCYLFPLLTLILSYTAYRKH